MNKFICCVLCFIFRLCVTIRADLCLLTQTSLLRSECLTIFSQRIIPKLEGQVKGDAGKIGIIGGSIEYTGAPYFSAITALKVGADLVYVITTENAAPIIKTYSPDLIVYPFLKLDYASKIKSLIPKMDVVVIGPGLGREEETLQLIYDVISHCKALRKPLIIDADGLYAISKNVTIIKDYPCPGIILTPNQREAKKISEAVSNNTNTTEWHNYWGGCVSVLVKGSQDHYYTSNPMFKWTIVDGGSGRRAGGQGDILSGGLGTMFNWALKSKISEEDHLHNNMQLAHSIATYAAAKFTRICNSKAYTKNGRSMTASDMLLEIHPSFDELMLP